MDTVRRAADKLKNTANNPAMLRGLNSKRIYYQNKAIKELAKARGKYLDVVFKYIGEAFEDCMAPSEIIASLIPNIPDYAQDFMKRIGEILDDNPEILKEFCIE